MLGLKEKLRNPAIVLSNVLNSTYLVHFNLNCTLYTVQRLFDLRHVHSSKVRHVGGVPGGSVPQLFPKSLMYIQGTLYKCTRCTGVQVYKV